MAQKKVTKELPSFARPALAPGLLGAMVLFIGVAVIDDAWFTVVRYVVSILAVIIAWFAIKGKQWLWLAVFIPVAVLWNPVLPLNLGGDGWFSAQLIAPLLFVAGGLVIKTPRTDEKSATARR